MQTDSTRHASTLSQIPRSIWMLGFVSMFVDISSEIIHSLHMGITQGLLATMVAQSAPPDLKGAAFGLFNLMSGLAMLVASVVAGELWDRFGASTTFYAGAGFCVATLFTLATRAASSGRKS